MKNIIFASVAGLFLMVFACSKDEDPVADEPMPEGLSVKVDGKPFVPTQTWVDTADANPVVHVPATVEVLARNDEGVGMFVAIEIKNGKVEPGTYPLKPDGNKVHHASIFYAEDLDQEESINYASYYVPIEEQDGQVIITRADGGRIQGTFKGKVLTAFGDVENPLKVMTEGTIDVEY